MADFWFTESVRVRDGAAASLLGAKVFQAPCSQQAHPHARDGPHHTHHSCRKVLRSLRRADLGAIRRICFHTHVCVFCRQVCPTRAGKRWGRTRRRTQRRDRFASAKQTKAKTAGVAEHRRARETGKPGPTEHRRGKAAWPHARRTAGPFSPATRAAEQGRP
jgi:hypothetical protein